MATTPEEFFIKGLMEQSPPSPPIFSNLAQLNPNGSSEVQHHVPNDMVLPYISRMLMEDDDRDDMLTGHPALLQVQQPFVQILSSPSFGANAGSAEQGNELLHDGDGDDNTIDLVLSKGTDAVRQAFIKGMEEANMLLPKDKSFIRSVELVNQMVVKERTSKSVVTIKEPEENCANKMLDEMMLHGYETCIWNMDKLRIAMDNNAVEKKKRRSGNKAAPGDALGTRALLLSCAQQVAANNLNEAHELLKQIKQRASATGDSSQRLAQCFAMGLEARLSGHHSQLVIAERPSFVEFVEAYNLYFAACCFQKVALSFSTMTIMHAMVGKSRLHVVDYGMQFGLQWSGLLRLLASREGGPPEVRITAIGRPKTTSFPAEKIEDGVGCRLSKCAHEFGLPSFKFHAIMTRNWEDASIKDLHTDADELLIVNDLFSFSTLMEESIFFDRLCPRDSVLGNIKKIRPDVFIQSVINCSYGSSSFLSRFRETLYYYTPLFDILDVTVPRESRSRLVLEQLVLGRSALNAIACEGMDLVERPEKYKQWQARNQRAGLKQLPLNPRIVEVVSDNVKKYHHKDFLICQDGQWLLQGWKGRVLFAHSTWVAEDAFSG